MSIARGDTDFNVSELYGILPAAVSGDPAKRNRGKPLAFQRGCDSAPPRAGWEQFGAPGSGYSRLSARAFPNSAPSHAIMASAINRFPRKLK
jgi:hypothetical protein